MSKLPQTIRKELFGVFGFTAVAPLLAQIIYWFGPSSNNGAAKTTIKREGKRWIAKTKQEWGDEIERSVHQCKRALILLKSLEIIEIRRWRFKGQVMCHVWLNTEKLTEILHENGVDTVFVDSLLTMANQNSSDKPTYSNQKTEFFSTNDDSLPNDESCL